MTLYVIYFIHRDYDVWKIIKFLLELLLSSSPSSSSSSFLWTFPYICPHGRQFLPHSCTVCKPDQQGWTNFSLLNSMMGFPTFKVNVGATVHMIWWYLQKKFLHTTIFESIWYVGILCKTFVMYRKTSLRAVKRLNIRKVIRLEYTSRFVEFFSIIYIVLKWAVPLQISAVDLSSTHRAESFKNRRRQALF